MRRLAIKNLKSIISSRGPVRSALTLFALTCWAWIVSHPGLHRQDEPIYERAPYDPAALEKTIAFFASRARTDPQNAIGCNLLASAYLQRCRETGDIADAARAERAARLSVGIRTRNNQAAFNVLAQSLFVQHRFSEALRVLSHQGTHARNASYLTVEIQIETGDYEAAAQSLIQCPSGRRDITGLTVRSRLLEINGQPERALTLMRQATSLADRNYDLPRENVAWFHMRTGDLLAARGSVAEAERSYREALELFPHHWQTLTGLTRLAAGRGDWLATLDWGKRAAAIVPTPEVLALTGDAYAALGKRERAEEQYSLVETIARLAKAQGAVYDRQRALFCADHRRNLDEALSLARRELAVRHDVYAFDTYAWVCCQRGELKEARDCIQKALARGTQDSRILYHAGMIAYGSGDRAQARAYLSEALRINPYFMPFAPRQAHALLARLD